MAHASPYLYTSRYQHGNITFQPFDGYPSGSRAPYGPSINRIIDLDDELRRRPRNRHLPEYLGERHFDWPKIVLPKSGSKAVMKYRIEELEGTIVELEREISGLKDTVWHLVQEVEEGKRMLGDDVGVSHRHQRSNRARGFER